MGENVHGGTGDRICRKVCAVRQCQRRILNHTQFIQATRVSTAVHHGILERQWGGLREDAETSRETPEMTHRRGAIKGLWGQSVSIYVAVRRYLEKL